MDPFRGCHSSPVSSVPLRSVTPGRFAPSCARPLSWRLPWTYAPRRVGLSSCWGVSGTRFPECNCNQAPKMRSIAIADRKYDAVHHSPSSGSSSWIFHSQRLESLPRSRKLESRSTLFSRLLSFPADQLGTPLSPLRSAKKTDKNN